MAKLFYKI